MWEKTTRVAVCFAVLALPAQAVAAAAAATPQPSRPGKVMSMAPGKHAKTAKLGALQRAAVTPSAADRDEAKRLCTDPQRVADMLGDGSGDAPVDGKATRRRTIYLDDAAYVVQHCREDGTLRKAWRYELAEAPGGKAEYVGTQFVNATPEGIVSGGIVETIRADAPDAASRWKKAKADGPIAESPADVSALSAPTREDAHAHQHEGRASTRVYPASHPRCFNANYNLDYHASLWPARGVTYYTNLPNGSWDYLVDSGRRTWDDRWNECGFPYPSRTKSFWGGSVPGLGVNTADLTSAVTIGGGAQVEAFCARPAYMTLACAAWRYAAGTVSGPGGQTWRMVAPDMLINYDFPWTDGALPGFYDVWSLATHEWGHMYGLNHVSGGAYDDWLAMYPTLFQNDTKLRYLSQGDLNGIAALYP